MEILLESILSKSPFYTASHVLIVVSALILGLLAYKRSPQNLNNKSFLALNLSLALWATITYLSNLAKLPLDVQIFLNRLTFTTGFILVITFFNFCLIFPERSATKPIIYRLALIICVVFAIFAGSADWLQLERITKDIVTFKPRNPLIFQAFFLVYALFSFWALAILGSKVKRLKGKKHAKVQYIFLAFSLFIIYVFATNLIPAFFGKRFFIGHTALGALIFIGFTSYAVIKHRLMDIRLVVLKSVSYTILAVVGVSFYVVLVFYLKKYYETIINPDFVFVAASFAVAFGFKPLGVFVKKYTDNYFAKGLYNLEELLKRISGILSSNLIIDKLASDLLATFQEELKISKSAFVFRQNFNKSEGLDLSDNAISKLYRIARLNKALVADELEDDSKKKQLMQQLGIEVLVFLPNEKEAIGFLALSAKRSGDAYTLQDLRLLEIIAPQIAIALKNIEQQQELIETIVEERRRIDQDAHDHIYNRLGALAKKAEIAQLNPAEAEQTLDLLKTDLRTAVSDLQMIVKGETEPASQDSDYIMNELKKICSDFENQSSIELNFDCNCSDLQSIQPQDFWHLQCILEECLNNARKHSHATKVDVQLYEVNGSLILSVSDNGIGIGKVRSQESEDIVGRVPRTRQMGNRKSGMGLKGMQERAKKINGEISFAPNNGKGTKIQLKIPVS